MGLKSLNITTPTLANPIPNKAALENMVGNAVGGNFDRDHAASNTSFITIQASSPASPKTGEFWLDTSASPSNLKKWSGSAWEGALYETSASAPATTTEGALWYDNTLNLLRRYESIDGISGWHPVDEAYQLWTNSEGTQISANRVVRYDATDTSNVRAFRRPTTEKAVDVIGVTMEASADGANAVIAMIGSGRVVSLYVAGSAYNPVARGDGLVALGSAGATKGEARTVGALLGNPYNADGTRQMGVPLGCFAEALDATSSDETIRVRLLGQVGSGAHVIMERVQVFADSETKGSSGDSQGGWAEQDVASLLLDDDHEPIMAVGMEVQLTGDAATGAGGSGDEFTDCNVEFSIDQSTIARKVAHSSASGTDGAWAVSAHVVIPTVDDSTGTAAGPGPKFSERVKTNSDTGANSTTATAYLVEYWY